jgi:hypothetical protein
MSLQINPQNNNNNNDNENEGTSTVLDLESLSRKYKILLIAYKQAVLNYVNFLKEEAATPCGSYNGNSTSISQECYNDVWKKGGCTTQARQLSSMSGASSVTLNTWILDTFNWATSKDNDPRFTSYNKRMGCYGNPGNSYIILGVGTDGYLYSRAGLDGPWQKVNDDSKGNLRSICTGNDGKTIYASTGSNTIWSKTSWDSQSWNTLPNSKNCCVISLAQDKDGTFIGVGKSHVLFINKSPTFSNDWTHATKTGSQEEISSICIAPDGSIFGCNKSGNVFKKTNYQQLTSEAWHSSPDLNSCCVKAMTIAPDGTFIGVGTNNQLYAKPNYKTISSDSWGGPFNAENGSCCVIGITTVANPDYNSANYNTSSQPNYKIESVPMTAIKGQVFWGTSQVGFNNSATLEECQASCASTTGCTGATFNPTDHGQPMCWLRGGEGDILGGITNDYAIIPKAKQLLTIVQKINQQLTSINQEIQGKTSAGKGLYESKTTATKNKNQELIAQFIQLRREREKIEEMVNEYQTLDEAQNFGSIKINQNYYSFVLLLALVVIIIFILYKFFGGKTATPAIPSPTIQSGGQLGNSAYYIIFGIIFVILLVHYYKNFMNF